MRAFLDRIGKALVYRLPLRWSRAIRYRRHAGRWPRVRDPRGINEKVNWRVLYDHREIWNWMCDKLLSRERAQQLSPGILLSEVIWAGRDLNELVEVEVTGRWILKSNSSSQDVVVGSGRPDIAALSAAVDKWDMDLQWRVNGERAYRYARPLVILERWITDEGEPPIDYKVFVFDGVARFIHAHGTRFSGHRASMYTRDWTWIRGASQAHILPHEKPLPEPPHLGEILRRAEEIAAGCEFLRVDLYSTEEGVWFGETTPYTWSGMRPFTPTEFELELGSYWTLPDLPGRRSPDRSARG